MPRIVANDPESVLVAFAARELIPLDVYQDPKPDDHYLSRVYRCWNYCVESSRAEYVCLVHTDMAFSPGWLKNLERRLDGKTLPVSRLVEPGFRYLIPGTMDRYWKLVPGKHAIECDLGRDPTTFPMEAWHKMAADLSEDRVEPGGLYGCPVIHRETFLKVGKFPEGNVEINGNLVSGDAYLFGLMEEAGFKHVTCFDSLVYHMQEGEMRPS